jgi:hypothetical protein
VIRFAAAMLALSACSFLNSVSEYDSGRATLATVDNPSALVLDGAWVYWTEPSLGTVRKVSKNGGDTLTLASGQAGPAGLVLDSEGNAYWANQNGGTIVRLGVDGQLTTLASGENAPTLVATDGATVYFGGGANAIRKVPASGGEVTSSVTVPSNFGKAMALAGDTSGVYAFGGQGIVFRLTSDLRGDPCWTVGDTGAGVPRGRAMDATDVYCAASDGLV